MRGLQGSSRNCRDWDELQFSRKMGKRVALIYIEEKLDDLQQICWHTFGESVGTGEMDEPWYWNGVGMERKKEW